MSKWSDFDIYLGSKAALLCVDSAPWFPSTRSNKPIASKTNENHQKKYPIPNLDTNPPGLRSTYQCELRTKAATATHAETRLTERDPLTATQGEPKINKTVATTLPVASRVSYHVPNTVSVRGQNAVQASKKAPHPVIGLMLPPQHS